MKAEPVYKHMTVCPVTVERGATLARARAIMRERGVRHLPVLDFGVLVGVLSERDIDAVVAASRGFDDARTVEEAMTPEPFVVPPDMTLSRVVAEMARHRYGCAIVVEDGHVAGIFTTVDALRALERVLDASAISATSAR